MIEVEKTTCPVCGEDHCLMLSVDNCQGGFTEVETAALPLSRNALRGRSLKIECGACAFKTDDSRICKAQTTQELENQLRLIHRSMEKEQG